MTNGTWTERLEAIAVGREVVAVGGRRDAAGVTSSAIHVFPTSLLEGKGTGWSLEAGTAIAALAFAGDELLFSGGDDGTLAAWDVTGQKRLAQLSLGGVIRAIALDASVARGDAGTIGVGTADGALHLVKVAFANAAPSLSVAAKHALSDGPITAVAADPAGLWVAGGADGQLRVIGADGKPRAIA
ncbi:MAG: hypothetical protein KIT31_23105, partial [Deltaproteobacteria bacterium]|nr:hypothetical protein [Deltaproteobacteria bacterium]